MCNRYKSLSVSLCKRERCLVDGSTIVHVENFNKPSANASARSSLKTGLPYLMSAV